MDWQTIQALPWNMFTFFWVVVYSTYLVWKVHRLSDAFLGPGFQVFVEDFVAALGIAAAKHAIKSGLAFLTKSIGAAEPEQKEP